MGVFVCLLLIAHSIIWGFCIWECLLQGVWTVALIFRGTICQVSICMADGSQTGGSFMFQYLEWDACR